MKGKPLMVPNMRGQLVTDVPEMVSQGKMRRQVDAAARLGRLLKGPTMKGDLCERLWGVLEGQAGGSLNADERDAIASAAAELRALRDAASPIAFGRMHITGTAWIVTPDKPGETILASQRVALVPVGDGG